MDLMFFSRCSRVCAFFHRRRRHLGVALARGLALLLVRRGLLLNGLDVLLALLRGVLLARLRLFHRRRRHLGVTLARGLTLLLVRRGLLLNGHDVRGALLRGLLLARLQLLLLALVLIREGFTRGRGFLGLFSGVGGRHVPDRALLLGAQLLVLDVLLRRGRGLPRGEALGDGRGVRASVMDGHVDHTER